MSGKRTRRTAAELLEAREEEVAVLKSKAALEGAMSSPELAPIVEALKEEQSSIIEAQKGLGEGSNSFDTRIAKKQAWIEELQSAKTLASKVLDSSKDRKAYLMDSLKSLAEKISQGSDVSLEIEEVLGSIPTDESLEDARSAYGLAHNGRVALTSTKGNTNVQ